MNWHGKNILITGVSGFVGSYLARELLDCGASVFGLVRRRADGSIPKNIKEKHIEGGISLIEGNLEDLSGLSVAIDKSDPDYIFHLGAQSFVPRSFTHPIETNEANCLGTNNLLEAIRLIADDPVVVFAGSSEEYGLVFSSEQHLKEMKQKYGAIFPEPVLPEVPISETNPLRPMSPYAVSKVYGDHLMRNYYHSYGTKTVVSRGFNHEGAGRGIMFVTSVVTNQVSAFAAGEIGEITIGNVNAFRDWTHVSDIIKGYMHLAEHGKYGDVYNQGSMRTTSVLSYILLSLEMAGYPVNRIRTMNKERVFEKPTEKDRSSVFGVSFEKTEIDRMMLEGETEFSIEDGGINVETEKGIVPVNFDQNRFRPSEVPILFSDTKKINSTGWKAKCSIEDIIKDQLNYFVDANHRQ